MPFKHVKHSIPTLNRITREDGNRVYETLDGKYYPSVTTVIKPHNKKGIDEWKARVGEKSAKKIMEHASDRGNAVHECIEALLNNYPTSDFLSGMMPHAKSVYFAMRNELQNCLSEVHGLEQPLYSDKLRLAGTADCIGVYNGKLSIIDFKTSKRLKKPEFINGYLMQVVAYAFMFQELTGHPIEQGVILIGVDNETKAQTFILPGVQFSKHLKELISWRDKYEQGIE